MFRCWQVSAIALLAACSPTSPTSPTDTAPAATAGPVQAAPVPSTTSTTPPHAGEDSRERVFARAATALADERLFAPPGDNALELYLQVVADAPDEDSATRPVRRLADAVAAGSGLAEQATLAINDLRPYALAWVRQSIASGDFAEARRGIALLQRVPSAASALVDLQQRLEAAQRAPEPAVAAARTAPAAAAAPTVAGKPARSPAAAEPVARVTDVVPATPEPPAGVQADAAPAITPAGASLPAAEAPAGGAGLTASQVASAAPAAEPPPLPAPLQAPPPRYPPRAQRQKIEGWVSVAFVVRVDGSVADARVVAAEPEEIFDSAALAAIARWKYPAPGRALRGERTFNFVLSN